MPCGRQAVTTSFEASASRTAPASLSITARGVPTGAIPNEIEVSKSGRPASAMVGTFGRMPGRLVAADASTLKPTVADYPYQQVELDFHLERGMVKLQRGQLAAAAEAFKKVLAAGADHEAATRELAEANRRLRAKKPGGGR